VFIEPATQFLGQVFGVFGARMECDQPVQVRKYSGADVARAIPRR
jgi:hypothetical protein